MRKLFCVFVDTVADIARLKDLRITEIATDNGHKDADLLCAKPVV